MTLRRARRIERLEERLALSADPIISEFVASNRGSLVDGFGAQSDWIELHNNGDSPVDLAGYTLTDDYDDLQKWEFPSVVLDPGGYLVVFASGADGVDPSGHFHTNFGLSAEGEYLALVDPLGEVLSEFGAAGADYPQQPGGSSYGVDFLSEFDSVVAPESTATFLVPVDGSVDASWMDAGFDDSAWQIGQASLGADSEEDGVYSPHLLTELPSGVGSVYVRIPFDVELSEAVLGPLKLRFDDGYVAYLNGSPIASANAPVAPAYDSLATDFRPQETAVNEAVFDISQHSGLLTSGENVLAIHLMDFPDSPRQDSLLSVSLDVAAGSPILPTAVGFLGSPTPGAPNTRLQAGGTLMSRGGGVFEDAFQLTLTPEVAGEVVRYTLDGSDPTAGSPLYTAPISIDESVEVLARSFSGDGRVGRVASAAFTRLDLDQDYLQSDLPIVVLENFSGGRPDREFQDAYLSVYDVNGSTGLSSLSDSPTLSTSIGQHRRGSSTYGSPKYSLRIELRNENGEDRDESLLGMPAESDWILYGAGTYDRSLIRNAVAYDLSNQIGKYAVRTRYVELYNNTDGGEIDASDYFGVYVLMETIKAGEDRVDVEDYDHTATSPPDITGGYIFKQDRRDTTEDANWTTNRNQPVGSPVFVHVTPDREELTGLQVDYLRGYIQEFEDVLYGPDWKDPEVGYAAYIDPSSWVEHHLFRTFFDEADSLYLSEHFTKDQDGRIKTGPVWDFNLSSGHNGNPIAPWYPAVFNSGWWWGRLFNDPDFTQIWVDQWVSLRSGALSDANLLATVESHVAEIESVADRNFDRWTNLPATGGGAYAEPGTTGWYAEVSHLAGWLIERARWTDGMMTPTVGFSLESGEVTSGVEIELDVEDDDAVIYYTTDGSDPRGENGVVAPNALVYAEPIQVGSSVEVRARAFNSARMSADLGPWGAMTSNFYSTAEAASVANLRVSELHYNPLDPTAEELLAAPGADNNSFEFVELVNISDRPIDLDGVRFVDGIEFDFTTAGIRVLDPGEAVVIVENLVAFEARYGDGVSVAGEYDGRLSSGGELIELVSKTGETISRFEYLDSSPWPISADGDGPSLVAIDLLADPDESSTWTASTVVHGTPGIATLPQFGDYDRNGVVDGADRDTWASQYGATVTLPGLGADGNLDGVIDAADYAVWRDRFSAAPAVALVAALADADQPLPFENAPALDPTDIAVATAFGLASRPDIGSGGEPPSRGVLTEPGAEHWSALDQGLYELFGENGAGPGESPPELSELDRPIRSKERSNLRRLDGFADEDASDTVAARTRFRSTLRRE